MSTLADLGEEALIELFADGGAFAGGGAEPEGDLIVPNGDDAAAWLPAAGQAVVATTDSLVEGVHFDRTWSSAESIGSKLIAVNLSDLAAMGARPRYALVSAHLPVDSETDWVRGIARGIKEACEQHRVVIAGGNVARMGGPVVLVATLIGEAHPESILRRGRSLAGDAVFVTGTLGDARAGLLARERGLVAPELTARLDAPTPRVEVGARLAATGRVHAACDVSDGLARDLAHLMGNSSLGATVDVEALPLSAALLSFASSIGESAAALALVGGEDYELLFSAAPADDLEIRRACDEVGVRVTRIGTVTPDGGLRAVDRNGDTKPIAGGFDHFAPIEPYPIIG